MVLALGRLQGQTFEINGQSTQSSKPSPARPAKKSAPRSAPSGKSAGQPAPWARESQGIGWGSSIQVSRVARAAQDAMRRGENGKAADFAQRAAQAAPQNPDFWFLYGYTARVAGRYQASIDAYNHGLQLKPSSIQGLSGLAQTYARMGNSDEAKKLLMRVIAANPRGANDLLLAGELFLNTDEPQKALPLLQRGDALQPSSRAEVLLAKAYQRTKQPERAKQMLQAAERRSPGSPEVLRAVAGFYREAGDYNSAIAALKKVRSRTPDLVAELAYTYQLAGNKPQAAQYYAEAANAAPQEFALQINAAQAQVGADNLSQAKTFIDRAAALQPDHYRVHAVRGTIAQLQDRPAEAIREYQTALEKLPEGAPEGLLYPIELRMTLAQLYRDTNDQASAEQQARLASAEIGKLQITGPLRPEFLRLRAAIENSNDDLQSADKDLKEALSLDPNNNNIRLQFANLLWRLKDKPAARQMFMEVLQREPNNRFALISTGYLLRDMGDTKGSEKYFLNAVHLYPNVYVPYLALGDLYTGTGEFAKALQSYEQAYKLAPTNPLIVAGGTNAALESHKLPLAQSWLERAKGEMQNNAEVMREHERYLTWTGKYEESARLGWQVIQKLPRDREGPVYLAYDLFYLNRYDDALRVVEHYKPILPKEKDLWLISGYVHTRAGLLTKAVDDFSHALELDSKMATGYVNRGFVFNDTQNAQQAASDFETALKLRPDYGEAHLGMAYANLQLHRPKLALQQANTAERLLGESKATHLARAGAYRQQLLLAEATKEYQAALNYEPRNLEIQLSLADTQYRLHRFNDSIDTLNKALALSPDDPFIYAQLAHNYVRLHKREETLRYIEAAERAGGDQTDVLLASGDALLELGDRNAAMDRFARALSSPAADRVEARLAIARVFQREGHFDDARQQISLAFAEARIGEAAPVTSDNFVEAAGLFLQMHDFNLAEKYFQRAKAAGADDSVIAIGMANTYLAQGQTQNAEAQLASLGNSADYDHNYDFMMAQANVYRQQQNSNRALMAFARATSLAAEDENAQRAELDVAGQEGRPITENVSVGSQMSLAPVFEDINIYQLDARLLGVTGNPALLPPPRHSWETKADADYKIHIGNFPTITGFVEERNANGTVSIPSTLLIQHRNTFDTSFNSGINPVLRLGSNKIVFNPGLQFTLRRDTSAPASMNQNLFRQYLYLSTSSFFNWVSMRANLMREAGPYTRSPLPLRSSDKTATLQFTVGRPWGRTALITEYSVRDIQFPPLVREYYQTSAGIGLRRKFGERFTASVLADYLRAWRVQDNRFAIAQALRPWGRFEYRPNTRWSVLGAVALSRGAGFHLYDNVQGEFLVSYVKPVQHTLSAVDGEVPVAYPLRFSVGVQQQTFYGFTGRGSATSIVPVIRLSLF